MPKIKTLLMTILVILLSFLVAGCGMLLSRDAEPEDPETVEKEGELPEWLLLAHRSTDDADLEEDELLKPKDPNDDEEEGLEEAVGGIEENETIEDPVATEEPEEDTGPLAPDEVTEEVAADEDEIEEYEDEEPKRGTMDYIIQQRQEDRKTYGEIQAEREAAERAEREDEDEDEDEDDGKWWD